MRNYGAMGDTKLEKVIGELRNGTGDARQREGDEWQDALRLAEGIAKRKGLLGAGDHSEPAAEVPSAAGLVPPRPMLAKPLKGDYPLGESEWITEAKIDGWRTIAVVTEDGVRMFMGRDSSDHTGEAPHIERELEKLPPGTILDGEVCYLDLTKKSSDVTSGLSNRDERLVFYVFDALSSRGEDLMKSPLIERKDALVELLMPLGALTSPVRTLPWVDGVSMDFHESYVAMGGEGTMVKRRSSLYFPGKRSSDTLKIKVEGTIEALIVGVKPGEGEHNKHLAGAFEVRMKNGVFTTVKIKNDEMVAAVTADPAKFLRTVVEIKHNGEMKSGKVRHPVVYQLRADYSAEEFEKGAAWTATA